MKYFYLPLLLLLLFPFFASAQSNYKPGYVVTLPDDTIHGFIDYKEWDKNPEKISFKKNLNNDSAQIYTVKNASAFAVTGFEYFKQYTISISQGQVDMSNLTQGANTSSIQSAAFLRVLTTGINVALFSYRDDIKTRYYVLENTANEPRELVYRVYYSPDNATYVQTDNIYRVQLQTLAQKYNVNNPKLQTDLSDAQYSETDLVKIVQKINGDASKQFTPASRLGTRWYAGLAVTNNNLGFAKAIDFPSKNSIYPAIALGFDLFPNKNTQKLFFRMELSLTENEHSFSYGPDAIGHSYSVNNINQRTAAFIPQIVCNIYNSNKLSVFIDAGASINISSYSNYYFAESFNGIANPAIQQFPELRSFWLALPLKAGVALNKKIELYARYTLKVDLASDTLPYSGNITTYQAGINYLFGIK